MKILCILVLMAQVQQPVKVKPIAIYIPHADIQRYLAGEVCFPRAPQSAPDGLPVVLRQFPPSDAQEVARALALALGAIPESHLIEVDDDLPVGFRDLGIVSHRGHHPFREQRLIGETIRPVRFCEGRK